MSTFKLRDDTHKTSMKVVKFSRPPPCTSTSEIILHPRSWTSNFRQTSPLQMITNQLKENMIQGWVFGYYMLSTKFIIIKGWLHYLTSESKSRFLVSNILCMMSGHGPNPIFFNKKRLDVQNTCCTPQPHYVRQGPIFILPLPHPNPSPSSPHQVGCHMCIAHNLFPCRLGYISQK